MRTRTVAVLIVSAALLCLGACPKRPLCDDVQYSEERKQAAYDQAFDEYEAAGLADYEHWGEIVLRGNDLLGCRPGLGSMGAGQ